MNKKISFIVLVFVVLLVFSGCTSPFKKEKEEVVEKEDYIPIEVEKVSQGEIYDEVIFVGRFFSAKDGVVISSVPGRVKSIDVKPGDEVKKGDLLFVLENEEIDKQVKIAKDGLDELKAKKSELKSKTQEIPPSDMVLPTSEMPSTDFGAMEKELDMKIAEVEKGYNQAKEAQEKLKVKSPMEGVVSYVNIKEGGFSSSNDFAMIVSDFDDMYVEIDVTDKVLDKLKEGEEVYVDIPSIDKKNLKGKIETINLSPSIKNGLYQVKVSIDTTGMNLVPGTLGKVKIRFDKKKDVVVVPGGTVLEKGNEKIVYVVENGKAKEKTVITGLDIGDKIEIKSGLKIGENLIVKGQNYVSEGSIVKIVRGEDK